MAYSYIRLPGNGSNTNFNFSFGYLSRTHVHVYVDNVETPFTWLSDFSIQITPAPANGSVVEIRRITPVDQQPVLWTDGSTITEKDMNLEARFNLYVNQEARDAVANAIGQDATGVWDGQGRKTTNFADPTDMTGLVTRNYFENHYTPLLDSKVAEATTQANKAADSADEAKESADNAAGSAANAKTYLDTFRGQYLGSHSTPPTVDGNGNPLNTGDLYYDTSLRRMRVFDESLGTWKDVESSVDGLYDRQDYIGIPGQTVFPATYDPPFVEVVVNGLLLPRTAYVATDGSTVVLKDPLDGGEEVTVIGLSAFNIANTVTPANLQDFSNGIINTLGTIVPEPPPGKTTYQSLEEGYSSIEF